MMWLASWLKTGNRYTLEQMRANLPANMRFDLEYRDAITIAFFAAYMLPQMNGLLVGFGSGNIFRRLNREAPIGAIRRSIRDTMSARSHGMRASGLEDYFADLMREAHALDTDQGLEAVHGAEPLRLYTSSYSGCYFFAWDSSLPFSAVLCALNIEGNLNRFAAVSSWLERNARIGALPTEDTVTRAEAAQIDFALLENPALAFFGSNIVSGTAVAVVLAVGDDTVLGGMAGSLDAPRPATGFEKGVNSVSWVLIRFMLVMVPVVLFLNGFTKGNWQGAFLFAVSIAVGLTPEMLPMIVTTCLAKGAVAMSKRKCIIKNLNSIQNFGAMDILCTDKTGTLTQDKVVLEIHMDIHGNEDLRVLRHAFLNSFHQTGLRNLMDVAIIEKSREMWPDGIDSLIESCEKVDEIPFDFERRRMSVVVADRSSGKTQMITKGAVEEMLAVSSHVEYRGRVEPLTDEIADEILRTVERFNDNGMRVIAVAQKNSPSPVGAFSVRDEADMVLIGYLAFLDPPKSTTEEAIRVLGEHGVAAKVLTGDNDRVTRCICRQVKFGIDRLLLGSEIEHMDDGELAAAVEKTNVFAKLSPQQKARIVEVLRRNGHTVGFLGDGINDAAAMKAADVGISVDTAVDIARESADIILLEKDLMVLESGILEGRRTYANMIKYIKMTASSNFGNMFSVLIASAFLPFLPMLSMQLLLLNLIYDISCTAIPWDNVDADYLKKPRTWDASSVAGFMLRIGPSSSVFDITTYLLMFYVICPAVCGGLLYHQLGSEELREYYEAVFQAGWFIESMWSQSLVIHLIRTPKLPFLQSRASFPVFVLSGAGIALATALPFTGFGERIGLAPLPGIYFGYLALTLILYMALTQFMKRRYIRRYGELL